jgi:hypothetical protein
MVKKLNLSLDKAAEVIGASQEVIQLAQQKQAKGASS